MQSSGQKDFANAGKQGQVSQSFHELKVQYSHIWQFFNGLYTTELSETGYKNLSTRFKIPLDEFKRVWTIFQKGAANE